MKHLFLSKHSGTTALTALLGITLAFTACTTPEQRHDSKISFIAHNGSTEQKSKTLAYALAQAEQALDADIDSPSEQASYNQGIEDVVALWLSSSQKGQPVHSLNVQDGTRHYQLHVSWPQKLRFDRLIPASTIQRDSLRQQIYRPGVGTPFVAQWKHTDERAKQEPFMSSKGYFASVTATLDFKENTSGQKIASLTLHNPNITEKAILQGRQRTLAFDQSALAEHILSYDNEFSALGALFRPHNYLEQIDLQTISPPDPDRIPVIFTHGLASEPRTWQNVYNELRSDPVVRERFQIYFFRYPTGVPVLYSAAKLRESLATLQQTLYGNRYHRYRNNMLLVGHSMGGLITKTQVQDSGDTMWLSFIDDTQQRVKLNEQQLASLQKYLVFKPNPHVSRVVFIATPHRGSELADYWIVKQLRKLIKAPGTIIRAPLIAMDQGNTDSTTEDAIDKLFKSGVPTSMENLSPKSDFVRETINLPLKKGLKVHSIVGNLKGLELTDPKCSDGVVPYTSAHVKYTESELVVPYGHSAHEHNMAIDEVERIMKLHLKELK